MGKREVDRLVRKYGRIDPTVPMPREAAVALAVLYVMLEYKGPIELREETRAAIRARCEKEVDARIKAGSFRPTPAPDRPLL